LRFRLARRLLPARRMNDTEPLTHRQRARAAGMSGDYWYPVEWDRAIKAGESKEVVFWKQSIALFRDDYGALHAIENRCPHRHIKLTLGVVQGQNLTCEYHGWGFNGQGVCTKIAHEIRTKNKPRIAVKSYPLRVRYGLVWIFPGDPEKAKVTALPWCPQLEGRRPFPSIAVDFTWKSHHTMITENVCDFYHEHLHRKYKPFHQPKLIRVEDEGERIMVEYETSLCEGPLAKIAAATKKVKLDRIKVFYDYPYQRSDIDGKYFHWLFLLPIDEQTTRAFFIFAFSNMRIPLLDWDLPRPFEKIALRMAEKYYVLPLLQQDGEILEAEMQAYPKNQRQPVFELNPLIAKMQALTVRKWEQYLS
jgi:phenylpropionate dioxygenase-like ring-hydroxylating dioxygenase large terminal subunit